MMLCRSAFNKENRLSPIIIHDPLINTCQIKYEPSTNTVYGCIPEQRSTKHTHKTKDRVTRTPLKRDVNSCSPEG
jgi:hypothetical protein